MTLRELEEKLEIPRPVALRLARMIPGARKEAAGSGQIPRWLIPDNALELITEEMLEAAREPGPAERKEEKISPVPLLSAPASSADPALRDEELAVKREKLAAEKIRAETGRLQAEAERKKVQEELKAIGTARAGVDPFLAERLGRLEQRIEAAMQRPDPTATVAEVLKAITPVVAPVMERLATPQPASAPTVGPTDLLNLAERIKGLIGTPETNLRREIREAFHEGLEIGRERAFAASGEGGESLRETIRGVVQGLSPLLPGLVQAARRAQPGVGDGQQALPGSAPQGDEGGGRMTANPVFAEILDALIEELKKPERDMPGVTAFLESLVLNEQGETLRDRLDPIARSPERLAQLSLTLIDPRLIAPEVWPGMKDLLAHVKQQIEADAAKGGDAR